MLGLAARPLLHLNRQSDTMLMLLIENYMCGKSVSNVHMELYQLIFQNIIMISLMIHAVRYTNTVYIVYSIALVDSSKESRPYCECDRKLMRALSMMIPQYSHYDASSCSKGKQAESSCCQWGVYHYSTYNPNTSCCGFDGVKPIGTC